MIIFFVSLVLTTWLVNSCSKIELQYLQNYGYFFDPASYYLHNIDLYRLYEQVGLGNALSYEISHNTRFPGRTVPLLLLAPHQLVTNLGHLWTEVPFIWLFLVMLMAAIYARTRTVCMAVAGTCLFIGVPYLYDPTLGIAGYWLDFTSACALGCGALSLIFYRETKNIGWMIAFGALAAVAALCRFSSAFYVLSFASLAVPVVLIDKDFKHTNWNRATIGLFAALLAALPGLIFLFTFLEQNRSYYSTYGYAFGAPIMQSIVWTGPALVRLIGMPILCVLLLCTAVHLVALLMQRVDDWRVSFIALWFPLSVFLFVCFVVKAVDGWHCLVYFIPALLVSAFVPVGKLRQNHIWWRAVTAVLTIVAIGTTIHSYTTFRHLAKHPPTHLALRKQADSAMARYILSTRAPSFIQFDTESLMPQLETFLNHGFFSKWPSTMFSIHEAYMKNYFPGKSPEEVAKAVHRQLDKEVALVAVFAKPSDALRPGVFNNPYSATVSKDVSTFVQNDRSWVQIGSTNSPHGKLFLYWNDRFTK